ncbi:MAG: glycosyltransferase family 4 protein [Bacteroidetes bacterium]|nr:glycosyltransferase family 4 protein [Bacteroidota bacterium]MBX7130691.1 glycosyltransferase family 4 protein [Flavobacteriales bacterium]MCC6654664.1 glycosyltransferase family 4 protein [Flavobacteriales bacterium]HMU12869.1 glycosyltransferase family 4 protein [Flavobacteriales bacterium]HMW98137.1 glycosyltransferase family 4 protein [Flavobacteriales bacterium]
MNTDRRLRIGYVTVDDPHDRRTWSGTNFYLKQALEARYDVVPLGPLEPQPELFMARALNQATLKIIKKRFNYRDSFLMARAYRRLLRRRLAHERLDLLVAPAGLSTVALLDTDLPIIHINDRCLAGALGYHHILRDLLPFSQRDGLALEQRTLHKAAWNVYASDWAADAARRIAPDVGDRILTIPFGVNFPELPPPPVPRSFPDGPLRLLFIGTKWEEKGGPIAWDTLLELKGRGIAATLTVCGCVPPADLRDPDLVRAGFLDKNDPVQLARLQELLRTADLLIVPTRFEAYGIVFCEAAAYGVPALATRTGGVPTIIEDGVTGFMFDPDRTGSAYADRIIGLVQRPEHWQAMRKASRLRFEQRFTWRAFVDTLSGQWGPAGLISRSR